MQLDDPIPIFTAESNTEALFLQQLLERAGIKAVCVEDNSEVGQGITGAFPGMHHPQVWISRADTEYVAGILEKYEQLRDAKRALQRNDNAEKIEILCDECGKLSSFSVSLKGTVQDCVHCATFLDVGEEEEDSMDYEWDVAIDEASEEEE